MADGFDPVIVRDERAEMTSLLMIVGFACFWAWFLAAFMGGIFHPGSTDLFSELFVRLCALAAMALTQLATHLKLAVRLSDYAKTKRLFALIVILAVPILAVTIWGLYTDIAPLFVASIAWIMLGVSMSLLLLSWGSIWATLDREESYNRTTAKRLAWSILLVACLCVFIKLAPLQLDMPLAFGAYLVSALLQMVCSQRMAQPESDEGESDSGQKLQLFSRTRYTPLCMGAFFGFTLAFMFSAFGTETASYAIVASVFLGGAISAFVIIVLRRVPRITTVERILFPIFALCFIAVPFLEAHLRLYPLAAIAAGLSFYFLSHWNTLLMMAYKHELLPIFHFSQGTIAPFEGLALGWGLQTVLIGLGIEPESTVLPSCLAMAFLTTLIPAIVSYKSNVAVEVLSMAEDGTLSILEQGEKSEGAKGAWKKKCLAICERFDLSPRETEVFLLLAKGRNAEHIHNELYISVYTAKTHGYRIYRKLNIHSQQELIDMVEGNYCPE